MVTTTHKVEQGECLSSIAKKYEFTNWRSIYDDPQNAEFRRRRPNPNIIYPGDELFIPHKDLKELSGQTEKRHKFKLVKPMRVLRIAVEDRDRKRMTNQAYTLTVDEEEYPRRYTDDKGMLEELIRVDAKEAKLTIGKYIWDTLLIADLNPIEADTPDEGVSGAQGRLLNMAYDVGPVDGILGPKTRAALKQFQADVEIEVTGRLDDLARAKLAERHGC